MSYNQNFGFDNNDNSYNEEENSFSNYSTIQYNPNSNNYGCYNSYQNSIIHKQNNPAPILDFNPFKLSIKPCSYDDPTATSNNELGIGSSD
jgi:hypothetical protein